MNNNFMLNYFRYLLRNKISTSALYRAAYFFWEALDINELSNNAEIVKLKYYKEEKNLRSFVEYLLKREIDEWNFLLCRYSFGYKNPISDTVNGYLKGGNFGSDFLFKERETSFIDFAMSYVILVSNSFDDMVNNLNKIQELENYKFLLFYTHDHRTWNVVGRNYLAGLKNFKCAEYVFEAKDKVSDGR